MDLKTHFIEQTILCTLFLYILSGSDSTKTLTSVKDVNLLASSTLPTTKLTDGILKWAKAESGYWCPKEAKNNFIGPDNEWFQIEFDSPKIINYISSRAKFYSNSNGIYDINKVFTYFKYQREDDTEGANLWYDYSPGSGTNLTKELKLIKILPVKELSPAIVAKRIRIYPYYNTEQSDLSRRANTSPNPLVCLQVSFNGKEFKNSLVEYRIPKGDRFGDVDLSDMAYDGREYRKGNNNFLTAGLGILADEIIYQGNSIRNAAKTNAIVGWRANQPNQNNVTLLFRFNSTRKVTRIQIHSFADEVDLMSGHFQSVLVESSVGGNIFNHYSEPFEYTVVDSNKGYMKVDLKTSLIGRFLRITVVSKFKWILLSEVSFENDNILPAPEEEKLTELDSIQDEALTPQYQQRATNNDNNDDEEDGMRIRDNGEITSDPYDQRGLKNEASLSINDLDYPERPYSPSDKSPQIDRFASTRPLDPDYDEITRKEQIDKMNQTLVTIIISISVPILIVFLLIFLFMIFRWKFCGPRRDKKNLVVGNCEIDPLKGTISSNDFYEEPINKYNYSGGNQQPMVSTASNLLSPQQLMGYTNQFYTSNNNPATNAVIGGNHGSLLANPGSPPINPSSVQQNQNYLALNMLQTLQRGNPQNPQQFFLNPMNQYNTMQTNNSAESAGSNSVPHKSENVPKNTSLTTSAGSYSSSSGNSSNENYMNQKGNYSQQQQMPHCTLLPSGHSQRVNMSLPPPPNQSPPPIPTDSDSMAMGGGNDNASEYASTSMLNMDINPTLQWNYQQTLMNLHQVNPTAALLLAQQAQQNPINLLQALQHQHQASNLYNQNMNAPDFLPPSTPPGGKAKPSKDHG